MQYLSIFVKLQTSLDLLPIKTSPHIFNSSFSRRSEAPVRGLRSEGHRHHRDVHAGGHRRREGAQGLQGHHLGGRRG